eukprot:364793-Chlamydomonas_euryale.AAC.5
MHACMHAPGCMQTSHGHTAIEGRIATTPHQSHPRFQAQLRPPPHANTLLQAPFLNYVVTLGVVRGIRDAVAVAAVRAHAGVCRCFASRFPQSCGLPSGLPASIPARMHPDLPTCLPPYLPACLHTYLPACLRPYLPACLHTYLPACLPPYLPACLHTYLPACLHICLHASTPA